MQSGDNRVMPLANSGMSPVLFWDESHLSADGAALACPQCGGANLHLDEIHFAAPTEDHYAPTVGVSIDAAAAAMRDGDDARQLHAGANRGPMLAAGYWCENGCRGRIELREHKGHVYASLHNQPPGPPDGVWFPDLSPADPAAVTDPGAPAPF
jgi:hypothetical protein